MKCKPFIKWVGGKRQLIEELTTALPSKYNRYFEPFVGGGALFFKLQPENAYLSDINPELTNVYNIVKNKVNLLIKDLRNYHNTKEEFYTVRNLDRNHSYNNLTDVQRASRFIFLNKTCFNGLYRTNSKGQFNVPFCYYKNVKIVDEDNLTACSNVLKRTEIITSTFLTIEE